MDIILRDIYYLRKLNFETRQLHVFSVRTGIAEGKLNLRRKDGTIFPGEVSTSLFTDRNDLLRTAMIISYIIFITFISTLNPKFDIKLVCDDLRENLMINFGNLKEHLKHY